MIKLVSSTAMPNTALGMLNQQLDAPSIMSRQRTKVDSLYVDNRDTFHNPKLDKHELWEAIMEALEDDIDYAPLTYTAKGEKLSYSDMMKLIPKDFIDDYVISALDIDCDEVSYRQWDGGLKQEEIDYAVKAVPLHRLYDYLARAGIIHEEEEVRDSMLVR